MFFLSPISEICLCIVTICILIFIRFIRAWNTDIHNVSSRLNDIEAELHQLLTDFTQQQTEEDNNPPAPLLFSMENKPTDIGLIRYHVQLHYPTLIEEIANFSLEKLTQTDELLCMMIKLGYNNKEVASILSITTNSVLTARYRLKRKLQLPDGKQLDSWISQIET